MTAHGMEGLTFWPFMVNPIAALVAPFFVGLIADRYFATQRVLGVLHVLGAVFIFAAPSVIGIPAVFILVLLAYDLCYMLRMSLVNTLAFHNMADQESEFPVIRVFGTIGWIVAGLLVSFAGRYFVPEVVIPEETTFPLYLTTVVSALYGLYSFTLPRTPPPAKGEEVSVRSIVGVDALKKLGSTSFYVFLVSSLLISIPLGLLQLRADSRGQHGLSGRCGGDDGWPDVGSHLLAVDAVFLHPAGRKMDAGCRHRGLDAPLRPVRDERAGRGDVDDCHCDCPAWHLL